MKRLDPNKIHQTIGEELLKLPEDKALHFEASYGLCYLSKQFSEEAMISSSVSIVKAVLDSFKVGLAKEYQDKGLDTKEVEEDFNELNEVLFKIYSKYEKNGLRNDIHETDLLADIMGSGYFMIFYAMLAMNWINHDKLED